MIRLLFAMHGPKWPSCQVAKWSTGQLANWQASQDCPRLPKKDCARPFRRRPKGAPRVTVDESIVGAKWAPFERPPIGDKRHLPAPLGSSLKACEWPLEPSWLVAAHFSSRLCVSLSRAQSSASTKLLPFTASRPPETPLASGQPCEFTKPSAVDATASGWAGDSLASAGRSQSARSLCGAPSGPFGGCWPGDSGPLWGDCSAWRRTTGRSASSQTS